MQGLRYIVDLIRLCHISLGDVAHPDETAHAKDDLVRVRGRGRVRVRVTMSGIFFTELCLRKVPG